MISFEHLPPDDKQPVYLQLVAHVKRQILLGTAQDGDIMPSRREIAMQANVNPNTVQKAYRLMEEEGFVTTDGNRLSTLHVTPEIFDRIQNELTRGLCEAFVQQAQQNNLSYKKAIALISEIWDED